MSKQAYKQASTHNQHSIDTLMEPFPSLVYSKNEHCDGSIYDISADKGISKHTNAYIIPVKVNSTILS